MHAVHSQLLLKVLLGAGAAGDGAGDSATSGRKPRSGTSTRGLGSREGVQRLQAKAPPRGDGGGGGGGNTVSPNRKPGVKLGTGGLKIPSKGGGTTQPDPTADPNGLLANVFALPAGTESLPDFATLGAPAATVPIRELNYEARGAFPGVSVSGETIGMQFVGSLNIVEEGEYTLCLNSMAGSRVLLDETLVVDNDGNHTAPTEKCEPVYMAAGEYGIEIDYFYQSSLGVKVLFSWNRDGGAASTPVPTSVLFKPGT